MFLLTGVVWFIINILIREVTDNFLIEVEVKHLKNKRTLGQKQKG